MEDKFNYDDFEEFLQDQVRNHRMYPADAVWREIDKKLHGEKRWPALTIAAALLVSATVLICVYFTPKPNIFTVQTANVNTSTHQASPKNNILSSITSSAPFSGEKQSPSLLRQDALPKAANTIADNVPASTEDLLSSISPRETRAGRSLATPVQLRVKNPGAARLTTQINHTPVEQVLEKSRGIAANNDATNQQANEVLTTDTKDVAIEQPKALLPASDIKESNDKNMTGHLLSDQKSDIPLLNRSKKISSKNKFSYLVYVAPSVSYRKLIEDNSLPRENSGGPVGLNYVTDVNKVVRHKPGTGIEAGLSIMYNLSEKVRLKSGFQFNMRQYSIEAYRYRTELASIALLGSNGIQTINTPTIYRNNNGYYSAKLVNRYYQLSTPIGVEWEIIGNKQIQLNVAGTIQPTYLLNRNAYLLSTNFKNYAESPGMIRQWNINSNIEAFISFKVGDFKWQLGPQLRYQPYSTFIPEYTIKEHLMDYGIKVGVSKSLY